MAIVAGIAGPLISGGRSAMAIGVSLALYLIVMCADAIVTAIRGGR